MRVSTGAARQNSQTGWISVATADKRRTGLRHHATKFLAIVRSVLMFRPRLEGTRSAIRTDHDLLKQILNLADATGHFAGWQLRLLQFDFDVVYRAGIKH